MRVGLSVESYKGISARKLVAIGKRLGLNFAEFTTSSVEDLPSVLPVMGEMHASFHLPIISENGFDLSCMDAGESIDRVIDRVNSFHRIHSIVCCVCHPPEPSQTNNPDRISESLMFENLARLEPRVVLENLFGPDQESFDHFYERAKEVLQEKVAGMCYDGPHFLLNGVDPIAAIDRYRDEIAYVHLSDCTETKDRHAAFGLGGALPIQEILDRLLEISYDGYINLEIFPRSFSEVPALIESYLTVVRTFDPRLYRKMRRRRLLYKPLLAIGLKLLERRNHHHHDRLPD